MITIDAHLNLIDDVFKYSKYAQEVISGTLENVLETLKEITKTHQPQDEDAVDPKCSECKKNYPCPTINLIHGWSPDEEEN